MSELLDRITAARKHAEGRMERATFQADYRDNKELMRLLEDVRDEITRLGTFEHVMTTSAQAANPVNTQGIGKTLTLKSKAA